MNKENADKENADRENMDGENINEENVNEDKQLNKVDKDGSIRLDQKIKK